MIVEEEVVRDDYVTPVCVYSVRCRCVSVY
jgi:hypothetical protein